MDALTALATRHSTRAFAPRPIPREVLVQILDAGRLAPSSRNEQPWEFVVVTAPESMRALAALADKPVLAAAAACVAVSCREGKYFIENGSVASENMLIAATALGIQSCWVAGDKMPYCEAVSRELGLPDGIRLVSMLALGYAADETPRVPKRTLEEMVHWDRW